MSDQELIKKYIAKEDQEEALKKLNTGYPVQYIIGNVDFYNSLIEVNESVLIPRFETELLVDKVIKRIKKYNIENPKILELGTGSGCISIAINKEIASSIDALDISNDALMVAKKNNEINKTNINFILSDLSIYKTEELYDIVISNPPYVDPSEEVDEKTKYEPHNAIYASDNGLYFYKIILNKYKDNLKSKYLIAFEIGESQGNSIKQLALSVLENPKVFIEKDYNERDRYVFITNYE